MPENYNYSIEVIDEISRIAHAEGVRIGKQLKDDIKSGQLSPGQYVDIILPMGEIRPERFSLWTRTLLALGTPAAGKTGNAALIGLGAYTGGTSLLQLGVATDRRARLCYKASFLFSSSAMVNGGFSILAKTCHISQAGIVSEAFGMAFLQLGNRAHNMALKFEGKNHLGQKTRPQSYSPDGLGFIMPRSDLPALSTILEKIPFQAIGQSIGISFTIYAYSKVVISGYRYGQQFVTKFKIKRRSRLLKKQAFFIIVRFSSVRCRFNHRIRLKKQLSPLFCASEE